MKNVVRRPFICLDHVASRIRKGQNQRNPARVCFGVDMDTSLQMSKNGIVKLIEYLELVPFETRG